MLVCDDKEKIEALLAFYKISLGNALQSGRSEIALREIPARKSAATSLLNLFLYNPEVAYIWGGGSGVFPARYLPSIYGQIETKKRGGLQGLEG